MTLIVNVTSNWGIGKDGDQPFYIKEDLAFFKKSTVNKTILMGKSTLLALPHSKPLPNRKNVVLTRGDNVKNAKTVNSLEDALEYLKNFKSSDVFIIGGASVYEQFLDYCSYAFVTKIFKKANTDTFFPNLDTNNNWKLTKRSSFRQENHILFSFCEYKNLNVKN